MSNKCPKKAFFKRFLPKHILVIRLSAMGDVAMIVPVLRALIQQYPQIKITVLTRVFFAPFFRDIPNITVFPAEVKGKHKGVLGLYKLSKELKELQIGAVADLHNVLRSNVLKYFFRSKPFVQINKGRVEKKALISGKAFKQLKSTHQRYADVFEDLGFPVDLSNPIFPAKSSLGNTLKELLDKNETKLIGMAPFAAHKGKMYPLDLMKEVVKQLSNMYKIVFFGGGQKEIEVLNSIESDFHNVINVSGKFSLDEELDIISNLDVMLSMDSSNAHIAAMLGVKVVTIWGVTHPFAGFTPFNQPEGYALLSDRNQYPKIPTSVYGNKYPENYKNAAGSISPEQIISKIKSIV